MNRRQTEISLLIATMSNVTFNDQSGETHTHVEDPTTPMAASSTSSDQSGETHLRVKNPGHPELYRPATADQGELANQHIEKPQEFLQQG